MKSDWKFDTWCVHGGEFTDTDTRAIRRPIHMANSYELPTDVEQILETISWDNLDRFSYTREHSPTPRGLEEKLAVLEGSEDCIVAASGMGAISATLFTLLSAGEHIVAPEVCYTGSQGMFGVHLPRFGVKVSLVDTTVAGEVEAALTPETRIVYIETPGNPLVSVTDIQAIADIAHRAGALLVVDSTWSGLYTQKPLQLGADIVVHSATKYINGHGDALGGAVMGPKKLLRKIREAGIVHLGACISPFNAWLITRGLVTLPLRMQRHSENAMRVARFLSEQQLVSNVRYPGLPEDPRHELAARQMSGFSGMMNFSLKIELLENFKFIKNLRMIRHAVSLGHDQSLLIFIPTIFFFDDMVVLNEQQRRKYEGMMGDGIYRFSVGIEDPDDIIRDLEQALAAVS